MVSKAWRILLLAASSSFAADFVEETIALGFPSDRGERLALAVVENQPGALAALERFAAGELRQGARPWLALEMIAYGGHEGALAVLGRLRPLAPEVVGPYFARVLEHSAARGNPFALAYQAVAAQDRDSAVREAVLDWAEAALASGSAKRVRQWHEVRPRDAARDPIARRLARVPAASQRF